MAKILIDNAVRWAVHPADQDRIKYIDGTGYVVREQDLEINKTVTLPFLVDPQTNQPTPVRISVVEEHQIDGELLLVPVVSIPH